MIKGCAKLDKMKIDLHFINSTEDQKKKCKIILGQSAYKQRLGNKELKVLPKHRNSSYKKFSEIAFLVNDWIKVQDSLEMIFNLLVGPEHSLCVLSYLKTNNISPECFAEYLVQEHSIYLLNSENQILQVDQFIRDTDINKKPRRKMSRKKNTPKFISYHVLYVGKQKQLTFPDHIPYEQGQAIHCSGVNLNNYSAKYNDTWYLFKDSELEEKTTNFSFKNFRITL